MSDGSEFDTGPYGWIFSFVYLFILWGVVICFSVSLLYLIYGSLDPKFPRYFGKGTFSGGSPKITFDPNPRRFTESNTNEMIFDQYDFDSYLNLLVRYKQVLKNYNSSLAPCTKNPLTNDEACGFDRITGFGDCAFTEENLELGMGFSKGQPCIMLKINKILGWHPGSFLNNTEKCSKTCCGEGIKFSCSSDDEVTFQFLPPQIPECYFPFAGQKGYEQPFIMVRMANFTENKKVTIECWPTSPELKTLDSEKPNVLRFQMRRIKND